MSVKTLSALPVSAQPPVPARRLSSSLKLSLLVLGAAALLAGCERPRPETQQTGYRGTGMVQVVNKRIQEFKAGVNQAPESLPPASPDGPKAGAIYQNVKVLGDLSVGEFTRVMLAMTQWVAPEQGCAYCHNTANLADDSLYTKVVSRRMIQMTRHLNNDWKQHVADTGVTCYTCHRGNNVPLNVWFKPIDPQPGGGASGEVALQNTPARSVGLASLPYDPFSPYLLDAEDIRVAGKVKDTGRLESTQHTEKSYALMMHMSQSLGQNCTYCHNTRNFGTWENSSPQRVTAYYGIRMARELNVNYMTGLTSNFPATRLGPTGDVAKVNCATCHQGVNKPINGAHMAKDYPELTAAPADGAASAPPVVVANGPAAAATATAPVTDGSTAPQPVTPAPK